MFQSIVSLSFLFAKHAGWTKKVHEHIFYVTSSLIPPKDFERGCDGTLQMPPFAATVTFENEVMRKDESFGDDVFPSSHFDGTQPQQRPSAHNYTIVPRTSR